LSWIKELLAKKIADEDDQKRKELEDASKVVHLSDLDRELIIRWLGKNYRVVFGGEPIAPPAP